MHRIRPSRVEPPVVHRYVERPRLEGWLKRHEHRRVMLFLAQAAQGKSTLASSFVRNSPLPSAWINLAQEDGEPVNLFHATAHGLSGLLDGKTFDFLRQYPATQLGPRASDALYRDWTRELFGPIGRPARIVFDGLDRLSPGAASFRFMELMVEEAPGEVRFLLLSRSEPPLPFHDWTMKQRALVLRNDDLAFTLEETTGFLQKHCGWTCSAELAKRIRNVTEGWTGGLVLLSQVLPFREAGSRLLDGLPQGFQKELFHYFAKEIFSTLSKRDARLLMHGSVFEELDPDLLDELLGISDSERILQELVRRNLFVSFASTGVCRLHLLFRDFLQSMWTRRVDPEQRKQFLRRVGTCHARKGDLEAATAFHLQAGELRRAASGLQLLGRDLLRKGRETDLAGMLGMLPERIVRARPWLLLYRACCRRFTHPAENVADLQKAEALFRKGGDTRGLLLGLAYLVEAVMLLGRDLVPVHDLLARGEELLASSDVSKHPREQAFLWLQMGFGYALRGENTRDGYRACRNASFLAAKLKDRRLRIHALIYAMIPLTFLGELDEGEEVRSRIEALLHPKPDQELEALFWKALSEFVLIGGRRDPALGADVVARLHERIERLGLIYLQAPALYSEFALHMYAGNEERTQEIGQRLQDMAEATGHVFGRGLCLVLRGMHAYRRRQWTRAGELLEAGLEIFSQPRMRSPLHYHEFSICAALVHLRFGNQSIAEPMLRRSLQYFAAIRNHLALAETHLSLALLLDGNGRRPEALEHLESGMSLASSRGYTDFVVLGPDDQLAICLLALEAGSGPAASYAEHLLRTGLPESAAAEEERLRTHPHPGVRKSMERLMLDRHRRSRPHVFIRTLGGFQVLVGGAPLPEASWRGSQPRTLLKALVALGAERQQVRREQLVDALWPDSEPEAGEKTFKAALHRLRKCLEPDMSPRFGSSYIHLKQGLVFLDSELCATDVSSFLGLCREARATSRAMGPRQAVKTFEEGFSLYRNDFLPHDPDPEWARELRERLGREYVRALLEAARSYETLGSWTKAVRCYERALDHDPLLEEACRRIMVLYADRGRRTKALSTYDTCRRRLLERLGVEPEELTTSLYRRIRGQ
jgi:ATP/maltotriose-dependent transcriptional regulator MalT/DNA-binding SARP family transcriptional activator